MIFIYRAMDFIYSSMDFRCFERKQMLIGNVNFLNRVTKHAFLFG